MKIFLCEDKSNIKRIYPGDFIDNKLIFNKKELFEKKEKFPNINYIFSTWGMPSFNKEELSYFSNLSAVFYGAGSVKAFAKPFLDKGVRVFSSWAANAIPVAEFVFAQIILSNKGYFLGCRQNNRAEFLKISNNQTGNYNIKIGIIGAGMIGRHLMKLLQNTDLSVLVYDPYISADILDGFNAKRATLDEIFLNCQVISNHLPNIPETVGMLNFELFNKMQTNVTFINTGRGSQVVEADLIRFLKDNKNATALLDVTEPEPPKSDSELFSLENVFLSPHIAGSMNNETLRMGVFMIDEYIRLLNGEKPLYEITLDMLHTLA